MDYPEPLIIPPRNLLHKRTFIFLHGRGSSGEQLGPALLATPVPPIRADGAAAGGDTNPPSPAPEDDGPISPGPTMTTLDGAFPQARFVFPTAACRRATVYR